MKFKQIIARVLVFVFKINKWSTLRPLFSFFWWNY